MAARHSVLIVDGDPTLRASLSEQLAIGEEFAPVAAECLAAAEVRLSSDEDSFDAILLADELPDGDGKQLLGLLRDRSIRAPVILMAEQGPGCPDCVETLRKPFRLGELLFRLRQQIRQVEESDSTEFTIGPFQFRPGARVLWHEASGQRTRLTEKEVGILRHLINAGDAPVERQVLLNEVWGYSAAVTTHTLETHIYRLRQKMEADPSNAKLLLTEGGGYRLVR